MMKVVISKAIHDDGMAVLKGKVETVVLADSEVRTAKSALSDADGLILRTNIRITEEILAAAPKLKIIARTGVGVDNVDVAAATERGIMVCNTPGVNANSVAEQALALMMAVEKRIGEMDRSVRAGNWAIRNSYATRDLEGMTLGLVGIGKIGLLVAQKCKAAFNMNVIAYDPFVTSVDVVTLVAALEELFSRSDIVSVHVPYTEQTHHLVDARLIGLMKTDSVLINTSRGPIVDEAELAAALNERRIAGAGLDVFSKEPPLTDNPLFNHPNVITTPHASALTRECVAKVAATAAGMVLEGVTGKTPRFVYNGEELGLRAPCTERKEEA